jgi:hypothetical protein
LPSISYSASFRTAASNFLAASWLARSSVARSLVCRNSEFPSPGLNVHATCASALSLLGNGLAALNHFLLLNHGVDVVLMTRDLYPSARSRATRRR